MMRLRWLLALVAFSLATALAGHAQVIRLRIVRVEPTCGALPMEWASTDIGSPMTPGESCFSDGEFSLNGSGFIGGTADAGHYAYVARTGDWQIVARLVSQSVEGAVGPGDTYCSAMIRNGLEAGSAQARVLIDGNGQAIAQWRLVDDDPTDFALGDLPVTWLRIRMIGGVVDFAYSADGISWIMFGGFRDLNTVGMWYIGLAADNLGAGGELTTCVFADVSIDEAVEEFSDSGCYLPDVPPVQGCGNTGGRDAASSIVIVNTLNDDNDGLTACTGDCGGLLTTAACDDTSCYTGSFREAVTATIGPRFVVFARSGNYSLSESDATIADDQITVACQTAPSPGVTIRHGGLWVIGSNVVLQHCRLRPGDGGEVMISTADHNALLVGYGARVVNFLCDHCSISWAAGKNFELTPNRIGPGAIPGEGGPEGVIFYKSITSEGLWRAKNVSDPDNWMGGTPSGFGIHAFLDPDGSLSVVDSLIAHIATRGPEFGDGVVRVLNSVVYDFGKDEGSLYPWATFKYSGGGGFPGSTRADIMSSVYITGPNPIVMDQLYAIGAWDTVTGDQMYINDILIDDAVGGTPVAEFYLNGGAVDPRVMSPTQSMTGITLRPASQVEEYVRANAGARPADRDAVDARIMHEVQTRTGGRISSQDEVGGFPSLAENVRQLPIPQDPNGAGSCGSGRSRIECWLLAERDAVQP